jgi:hypothetical protein
MKRAFNSLQEVADFLGEQQKKLDSLLPVAHTKYTTCCLDDYTEEEEEYICDRCGEPTDIDFMENIICKPRYQ